MSDDTVSITPPPGPLAWLHPELLPLHPPDLPAADSTASGFGDALVERAGRARTVRIEDGPRGVCVQRFLRERLRGKPVVVELDGARPSFERRLARGEPLPVTKQGRLLLIDARQPQRTLLTQLDAELAAADRRDRGTPPPIPLFLTNERTPGPAREAAPVHTRLRESWFGLLPGDEYHEPVRARWHELLRRLHPDRFLRFLAFENAALAGIDLYDEVVRERARTLPAAGRAKARVFVVEGIDGAGKSTHVAQLAGHLESKGLACRSHKLFRHGLFHETVTDLTRQCEGERNLHLWPLQRLVKVFDSLKCHFATVAPDLERCDAVVFDRYAPTHLAEGIGRYHHDPFSRELLAALPAPDRVFLLDLPESDALARLATRATRTVDENPYMLGRYRAALLELARRDGHVVLDARAPFETNQRRMREEVDRCLAERRE